MPAGRALTIRARRMRPRSWKSGPDDGYPDRRYQHLHLQGQGPEGQEFLLGVSIDEIAVTLASSAKATCPPTWLRSKGSPSTWFSPLSARKLTLPGAEAVTYDLGGETRNLASGFKTFFPDLPGKPVKIGDTWPSSSSVVEKTTSMNISIDLQNVNTLEGFETVDGMECARISSQVTGIIKGTGNQMGMDMTFSGPAKAKTSGTSLLRRGSSSRRRTKRPPRCPSTSPPRG